MAVFKRLIGKTGMRDEHYSTTFKFRGKKILRATGTSNIVTARV
jgi:hypothetical protein